jgi:arsenate reductase
MPQAPSPEVVIYHNARCSKSRSACEIVAGRGIEARIVEYLKTPPSRDELCAVLQKLGMKASELVRRGEEEYKQHYAGRTLTEDEWLDAMAEHPILIERPIVVRGDRAVVGRPPEKVLELLDADD